MTVKIADPERIDAHDSTWVNLDGAGEIEKIETFPLYRTEWRCSPVVVTMACDRYRHSSGMSDWRCYAREARSGTQPYASGPYVSDTARRRLSDACRPLVAAWLESDAFAQRYARAVAAAIVRELSGSRTDAVQARRFAAKWRETIGAERADAILTACDARDAYDAALEAVTMI